ncbi:FAD-binding protein [Seonamhaeicola sp.]|uniref:FAD-binding protein n=1 Tax=Seonamhaeicola sp. TaxID=1912245 RepID=UPI0026342184|nr:FAD-binding protein [Seonamhaeicola sp.]
MKRKKFLQTTSAFTLGTILTSPLVGCLNRSGRNPEKPGYSVSKKTGIERRNWGRNIIFRAEHLEHPSTVQEVQELMLKAGNKKALGSTHSYNDIADSPMSQISLRKLNKIISIEETNKTVTIEGGIKYEELVPQLYEKGFALHNLASLPQVTVAGACSTGTHGSGTKNGNLSTAVRGLEICLADGQLVKLSRDNNPNIFDGAVISMGGLGIITSMVLDIQPAYEARQDIFLDLPLENVIENFDQIMSSGYSVSLFTKWQSDIVDQVWIKRRVDQPVDNLGTDFFGGKASDRNIHPIIDLSAESCTDQMGVAGPWYDRLPHFKINAMPSAWDELQSEYFVPIEHAGQAMRAIANLGEKILPYLYISEVRTVAADNLWMSQVYKRTSVAFHFTWKSDWPGVKKLLPELEAALAPFDVRPHWAKLFTINPKTLQKSYKKFPDFLELLKTYDPKGHFKNAYLDSNIYS